MDTAARVIEVLSKSLVIGDEQISMDSLLVEDLNVSSLDRFEILMNLEEEFHREIDESALVSVKTVGDLVAFIDSQPATA
jgi:acyl carrier protein